MRYFDLNTMLGRGTLFNGDYAESQAILAQMDYLGIDRALVWSAEARDWSPVNGNRRLLEQIEPYRERLLPCFVITPRDFYERGTLDFYREQCASGRVRSFRICPKGARSPVRECEFVLSALAEFSPLVHIDTRELTVDDYARLSELAGKLPSVHFVLGQKIWCDLDVVFNLMKRCPNVLLDTSWLHVRGTLEMIVEQFGPERLLFATGHKSQNGAAIGTLMHAEISDEARETIGHRNAEKLLGLPPLEHALATPPPILEQKPLWRALASGKPLTDVEIIDAHTHQGGPASGGYLLADTNLTESLPGMIKTMDHFGISRSITIGSLALYGDCRNGNRHFAEEARPYRNRFSGYWAFNPWQCEHLPESVLDEDFADGFFVGFKILSAYWHVRHDDPRYRLMWEFAEKRSLPVLIHTWNDIEPLWNVCPKYPHVKFIVAHCGGGDQGRGDALKLAEGCPNVYLETCGSFTSTLPLDEAIRRLGPARFVFGTDAAFHNVAFELSAFLSNPLPDEQLMPILGRNFRVLSGI